MSGNKKTIPYGHQWIDERDIKEVVKVLKSDWLTQGPKVEEFEKKIAEFCRAKYAIAVSSGTSALELAYLAVGIGPGDEVITTPLTFVATSNMIVCCGARPVFVDIESDTLNINPELIERLVSSRTKAIVIVDFAGHPCDHDEVLKIAKKHNLLMIEDAAHALGSEYRGRRVGGIADMTIFSFHPVKLITSGEGGMVLTNNKNFYEKLKILRHHGIIKRPGKGGFYYEIENPGYNFRITDFQCALGLSQFKKLDKFIKRRREIVENYNQAFENIEEIITPSERDYVKSAWHIYPIQLRSLDRQKVFAALQKEGLGVQVHYMPLHLHPFYKKQFGYKTGDFPIAEKYYQRAITLPLFPKMTNKNIEDVIRSVKRVINFYKNGA